jgi:hypothetical protein
MKKNVPEKVKPPADLARGQPIVNQIVGIVVEEVLRDLQIISRRAIRQRIAAHRHQAIGQRARGKARIPVVT